MQTHSCEHCGYQPITQSALSSISWALLGLWGEMMSFISLTDRAGWKPDKLSPPKPFFSPGFCDTFIRKDFLGAVGPFFIVKVFPPSPAGSLQLHFWNQLHLCSPLFQLYDPCISPGEFISTCSKIKLNDVIPNIGASLAICEGNHFTLEVISLGSVSASRISACRGTPQGSWQTPLSLGRQSREGQSI